MKIEAGHLYKNNSGQIRRVNSIFGKKLSYTVVYNAKTWPINTNAVGKNSIMSVDGFRAWASFEVDEKWNIICKLKETGKPKIKSEDKTVKFLFEFFDSRLDKI